MYSTLGCHLCEVAGTLVRSCEAINEGDISYVDIGDDNVLIEQYGVRIPVLRHIQSGDELRWPFDDRGLLAWLDALPSRMSI